MFNQASVLLCFDLSWRTQFSSSIISLWLYLQILLHYLCLYRVHSLSQESHGENDSLRMSLGVSVSVRETNAGYLFLNVWSDAELISVSNAGNIFLSPQRQLWHPYSNKNEHIGKIVSF